MEPDDLLALPKPPGVDRDPLVWATAAFAVATIVAFTASTSSDPARSTAAAFIVGGVTALAVGVRDRLALLIGMGALSVVAGALFLADVDRYDDWVVRSIGVLVVIAGLALARNLHRRGTGLLMTSIALLSVLGASLLFVRYERDLLSLTVGVIGAVAVALLAVGLAHSRDEPRPLRADTTIRIALGAIGDRAASVEDREHVSDQILFEGPERQARFIRFLALMGFASAIASLGVIADSTAVVIGAMLVAPLLTPLMGMSLSMVMGWASSLARASVVAGAGVAAAVTIGFLTTAVLGRGVDVDTNTQIVSRSSPTLLDLAIAVAAGGAGAYAVSRKDVSNALPGVAVAIALVPPLAVVGVCAQLGAWDESFGALVLFSTNALAILATGAGVFVVTGVAATEAATAVTLDRWLIGFSAVAVAVSAALLSNTAEIANSGSRTAIVTMTVSRWIDDQSDDQSYEVDSVTIDDDVLVVLTGPELPDDTDGLAAAIQERLGDSLAVTIRVALTDEVTVSAD